MTEKIKKIAVYVENMGLGKASIADSFVSVTDFPNKKEGKQAVGVMATKTEMPESHLKAFTGMLEAHYPHQLNILSKEEYEAKKKSGFAEESQKTAESQEKELYDAAMNGGDSEVGAYMDAYQNGARTDEVHERSVFLDAKTNDTKKSYKEYLEYFPAGQYVDEVTNLLQAK